MATLTEGHRQINRSILFNDSVLVVVVNDVVVVKKDNTGIFIAITENSVY